MDMLLGINTETKRQTNRRTDGWIGEGSNMQTDGRWEVETCRQTIFFVGSYRRSKMKLIGSSSSQLNSLSDRELSVKHLNFLALKFYLKFLNLK